MLLPHSVYVIIILGLSAIAAGIIVYGLMKAIPRGNQSAKGSMRGCASMAAFLFLFCASLVGLMWVIPHSIVITVDGENGHSRQDALMFRPADFMKEYGLSDFEFDKHCIVNTSDRDMTLYRASFCAETTVSGTEHPAIDIPAGKCTFIKPEYLPDYYFENPADISVSSGNGKTVDRWFLDYLPTNP